MKKWIFRIAGTLLLLIIILVGIVLFTIDGVIRSKVQSSAQEALGNPTTLKSSVLSIFAGKLDLNTFTIANGSGFDPHDSFVNMGDCTISVDTGSLLKSTVVINEIHIDGLKLAIEQNGLNNNLQQVLDNVKKYEDAHPSSGGSSGKNLNIGKVLLTNCQAQMKVTGLAGQNISPMVVDLPTIELDHPVDSSGNETLGDLVGQIVQQIAKSAQADPRMPAQMRAAVATAVASFGKSFDSFSPTLQSVTTTATKAAEGVIDDVGKIFSQPKGNSH